MNAIRIRISLDDANVCVWEEDIRNSKGERVVQNPDFFIKKRKKIIFVNERKKLQSINQHRGTMII